MQASQLFQDIASGCVVEVEAAASSYYDSNRGLTVRQSFYVYPDDSVVCLNYVDGSNHVLVLNEDNKATFHHLYLAAVQQ